MPTLLSRAETNKIANITPDPGKHLPHRPCAKGRTRAKHEQAQALAPGQKQNLTAGAATKGGRRTKHDPEGVGSATPTTEVTHYLHLHLHLQHWSRHGTTPRRHWQNTTFSINMDQEDTATFTQMRQNQHD